MNYRIQGWSDQLEKFSTYSEFLIKNVPSTIFDQARRIYVALPENYTTEKEYPVVYVTDAQNLNNFEILFQTLRQQANYKIFPECIVVGIYHYDRYSDLRVGQPKAEKFKDFIFDELIDYVDENFPTSEFRAMIGHSDGAEYNHYLMMQAENSFNAFFSISEEIGIDYDGYEKANEFLERFKTFIESNTKELSYFVATGTFDIWHRREAGEMIDSLFSTAQSTNIAFQNKVYPGEHNDMVAMSMLDGLKFIFRDYKNFNLFIEGVENKSFDYVKLKREFIEQCNQYGSGFQMTPADFTLIFNLLLDQSEIDYMEQFLTMENANYKNIPRVVVARIYYEFGQYDESLHLYNEVLELKDQASFQEYGKGNFTKVIDIYVDQKKNPEGAIEYLNKCKQIMPPLKLIFAYYIARVGLENNLNKKLWQNDLEYCKNNFTTNRVFTKEELQSLIEQ